MMDNLSMMIACLLLGMTRVCHEKSPAIATELAAYLSDQKPLVERGTEEYYALVALGQALKAFNEGNYGIGAAVLLKWKDKIYEFRDSNAMVTGYRLRDHAEARALDRAVVILSELEDRPVSESERARLGSTITADDTYLVDTDYLRQLPDGLHVYGTLEPCPMCMIMMLNAGVKSSISLARDGDLADVGGQTISDGSAMATADKFKSTPRVWQTIREGQGLEFKLFSGDQRLCDLGLRIFLETREKIDDMLAGHK